MAKAGEAEFVDNLPLTEKEEAIFIDPSKTFQTVLGIGGALTDASAETFYKLPEARQQEILRAYFDPQNGIGYTLGRTHIHSCDFSSESYTYGNFQKPTLILTNNFHRMSISGITCRHEST